MMHFYPLPLKTIPLHPRLLFLIRLPLLQRLQIVQERLVSSVKVKEPLAVRYAWAMNPSQRNLLYNREGLPASPFRTDDWPLFDPDAELVEVNKPEKPEGYEKTEADWERPTMTQ